MNEKILVVDDEKEIADLLEVYLKNDNYIVHKYYNGIEALECIQKTEIETPGIRFSLQSICTRRSEIPHFSAASGQDIYSIS